MYNLGIIHLQAITNSLKHLHVPCMSDASMRWGELSEVWFVIIFILYFDVAYKRGGNLPRWQWTDSVTIKPALWSFVHAYAIEDGASRKVFRNHTAQLALYQSKRGMRTDRLSASMYCLSFQIRYLFIYLLIIS